jgi:hypothetical protein
MGLTGYGEASAAASTLHSSLSFEYSFSPQAHDMSKANENISPTILSNKEQQLGIVCSRVLQTPILCRTVLDLGSCEPSNSTIRKMVQLL